MRKKRPRIGRLLKLPIYDACWCTCCTCASDLLHHEARRLSFWKPSLPKWSFEAPNSVKKLCSIFTTCKVFPNRNWIQFLNHASFKVVTTQMRLLILHWKLLLLLRTGTKSEKNNHGIAKRSVLIRLNKYITNNACKSEVIMIKDFA